MKIIHTDINEIKSLMSEPQKWRISNAIERTEKGRLFVAIASGAEYEDKLGNYVYVIKSDDDGQTWSDPVVLAYLGVEHRINDAGLWISPKGELWFNFIKQPENATYYTVCSNPDADNLEWSDVKFMAEGGKINKPTVLTTGEWIFPISVWNNVGKANTESYEVYSNRQQLSVSYDEGKSIEFLGKSFVDRRCCPEHMVLEMKDGSLNMYSRTWYGIAVSSSYDKGKTWTDGVDSGFGGPNTRFHIRRLPSGKILFINNFYNPLDKREWPKRTHLEVMISEDECQTFKGFMTLDARCPVSYPDAVMGNNGFIYAISDFNRYGDKEILLHKFTEEDVLSGRTVNKDSFLCKVIVNG